MTALRNAAFVAVPVAATVALFLIDANGGGGALGTAHAAQDARAELTAFDTVQASAGTNVIVTGGDAYAVSLDERAQRNAEYAVEDGVLRITCRRKKTLFGKTCAGSGKTARGTLTVTAPAIDALRASSGAALTVRGDMKADTLSVDASSGATLNAEALVAASVEAEASSGASVRVTATDSLEARASSGGSIRYAGKPQTDMSESSGGSVRQAR